MLNSGYTSTLIAKEAVMRVLLTWELGGALGHLMSLRPLAQTLLMRGHQVFLAARDLSQVLRVFQTLAVTVIQAPWSSRRSQFVETVHTYADLLLNVGYSDVEALRGHVEAWRTIFDLVRPDLMVCDHSPTALLAARDAPFAIATAGTGFFCPIDESPLRSLRSQSNDSDLAATQREQYLLDVLNRVCDALGFRGLDRVTALYYFDRLEHFLLTFTELDHFVGRHSATYWGTWPFGMSGEPFVRPGRDPCVFGYLKPFPRLISLLADLSKAPFHTVAYVDGLKETDRTRFESDKLRLPRNPINIQDAADQCDVALTNATHGTCIAMLLKGKPLVHVPYFLEQSMFADATQRLGVSVTARPSEVWGTRIAIEHALANSQFRVAAAVFADRYRQHRFDLASSTIVDRFEDLVAVA